MECAFGILSNKWRIFQRPLDVSPAFAVDIVKACVVLRSFVRERERERERDGCNFEEAVTVTSFEGVRDGQSVRGRLTANNVRNTVADMLELFPGKCKKYEQ